MIRVVFLKGEWIDFHETRAITEIKSISFKGDREELQGEAVVGWIFHEPQERMTKFEMNNDGNEP
jgi:hypothetical protein